MNLWLLNRQGLLLGVFLVMARYFEVALLEIRKECHTWKCISKICKFWSSISRVELNKQSVLVIWHTHSYLTVLNKIFVGPAFSFCYAKCERYLSRMSDITIQWFEITSVNWFSLFPFAIFHTRFLLHSPFFLKISESKPSWCLCCLLCCSFQRKCDIELCFPPQQANQYKTNSKPGFPRSPIK